MSEQWMTYREAAAQHGVTAEAIRQLALRRHWPRRRTNTLPPRVEVLVPEGEQITPKPVAVQRPSNDRSTRVRSDMTSIVSAFEAALGTLREQLERSERGREGAVAQGNELRARIEALQAQLERATSEAGRAVQALEERERADAARKARGLLARLRAAVRGR